jgi:hypothetical protein
MSAAREVEDACARGAKPRPAGRDRARGRRATRLAHVCRGISRSALGSARRCANAEEADSLTFRHRRRHKEAEHERVA